MPKKHGQIMPTVSKLEPTSRSQCSFVRFQGSQGIPCRALAGSWPVLRQIHGLVLCAGRRQAANERSRSCSACRQAGDVFYSASVLLFAWCYSGVLICIDSYDDLLFRGVWIRAHFSFVFVCYVPVGSSRFAVFY